MNRLEQILGVKREEIERLRPRAAELERQARARNDFRDFRAVLQRDDKQLAVIAESKKGSPSAGVIMDEYDPAEISRNYESRGADAISVLTDAPFFQGNTEHLVGVRRATSVPLLRKDFILDELQVAESGAIGADAILLIVAALKQDQLVQLLKVATEHRLGALVEVHNLEELGRALEAGTNIIGINNRDLTTFEVDLGVTEKLCREVPDDIVLVSESGIRTTQDVARIRACGADAILVGEALMRGELSIGEIRS